jgi:hypothetical protein
LSVGVCLHFFSCSGAKCTAFYTNSIFCDLCSRTVVTDFYDCFNRWRVRLQDIFSFHVHPILLCAQTWFCEVWSRTIVTAVYTFFNVWRVWLQMFFFSHVHPVPNSTHTGTVVTAVYTLCKVCVLDEWRDTYVCTVHAFRNSDEH